jgi:predicted TIM-barrel fold metal-dependent hydrolase
VAAEIALGGQVDADVHVAPASLAQLHPYLDDYWRSYVEGAGVRLPALEVEYPADAPTTGGPAPSTYEGLDAELLTPQQPAVAILNCLSAFGAHRHTYYAAALATAINDWLRDEWLARDDRLRASIVVSQHPEDAAAEIRARSDDPRFVQVLLPIRADAPYGNRRYHCVLEAAAESDLVVGLHAWGRPGSAPTPNAFTYTHLEDYLSNQIIVRNHVLSLISEGAFDRFPTLRVSLLECGFAWLPSLLWRFDKDWKGLWREVPWVREKPSVYLHRHIRATTAPTHLPADPVEAREMLDMIGTDVLMYASDHPHRHGPTLETLDGVLDAAEREALLTGTASAHYRLT